MSLENEYYNEKAYLEAEKEKLAKLEATEIKEDENKPFSIEERTQSKQRGINSIKEDIKESTEILKEIREELIEFINNGGEVSELTKKELGMI
jgi:hypothetical protein